MSQSLRAHQIPEQLRIAGRSMPPAEIAAAYSTQDDAPLTVAVQGHPEEDAVAIDLGLHISEARPARTADPTPGTDYAGMTPYQRQSFLTWAMRPTDPAAGAFQQLYIAHQELNLLEGSGARRTTLGHLLHLNSSPAWQDNHWLGRALMLGFWLEKQGNAIANWLAQDPLPASLLGIALGHQALLQTPLTPEELGVMLSRWGNAAYRYTPELLKLRLASLTTSIGDEPLAYILAQQGDEASTHHPWRTAQRALRLRLPQPETRPALAPLLDELLALTSNGSSPFATADLHAAGGHAADTGRAETKDDDDGQTQETGPQRLADLGWRLILEFGHSRSEHFDHILHQCQKQPSYTQMLDENRRLVYRVMFRKSEMRRFWRIWDYVQGWSSTRVYLNGEELEKWKIWPYSQYLR